MTEENDVQQIRIGRLLQEKPEKHAYLKSRPKNKAKFNNLPRGMLKTDLQLQNLRNVGNIA